MMRLALAGLLLGASAVAAAPVPKELKSTVSTAGAWQLVSLDAQTGRWIPSNQYWIIDADCGVIFCQTLAPPPAATPTEIFKFDHKTGRVDHNLVGGKQRTLLGVFELKDDLLTICLDTAGTTRPASVKGPGSIWHLQRVKGEK